MCGRYAASKDVAELVEVLDVDEDRTGEPVRTAASPDAQPAGVTPNYNVAPTTLAPIVVTRHPKGGDKGDEQHEQDARPTRQLRMLAWGLVPAWAKDPSVGTRMINARAETLLAKPAYAKAAAARRCLIPADGYYEWQRSPSAVDAKGKPRKQPFYIHRADGAPVVMAGLYEFWRDRSVPDGDPGAWLTTYCVITTGADPDMATIHDRQPLVLEPDQWADWLDPDARAPEHVQPYLDFAEPGRLEAYAVSTAVNNVRNNGPQLLDPAPADQLEGVVDPTTGEVL
ncbi:SOS response-associated peptidase [Arsenicicoccus sp. oral taxon 190]|uniref:SOS response-associated peptidase n=1 Tax=Arsenicicoccus sp. oral taxon 190 TaxID=1658671 RepID=UPI00067A34C9|nr:SOS response-associated peptidase [Arsenicicoccus sp. oral taxon 190]AKT51413.1 hypothetical protein ADJ73_08950 [Arsenicicoccus sp. oral taxon 190]